MRTRDGYGSRNAMIRQDTRHPDKCRRHQGRAWCAVAGRRFETTGPAPIYKLVTLLWLHGHGGEHFEVWDDLSPFSKPGGLALCGRVRNWARLTHHGPTMATQRDSTPRTALTTLGSRITPGERKLRSNHFRENQPRPLRVGQIGSGSRRSRPAHIPGLLSFWPGNILGG